MKNKKLYIVFLVSLSIFLFLAFIVYKHNYISNYELKIINFIQKNLAAIPLKVPVFITDLAYGIIRNYIVWIVALIFLICKKYKDFIIFLLALPITQYLYSYIKIIIARPRPPIEMRLIEVKHYSFPSGHSIMSMVLYGLLIYFVYKYVKNRILKIALISILSILIIAIGFSRVWLGVHFPTDVIGGFALGICCLCLFIYIDNFKFK